MWEVSRFSRRPGPYASNAVVVCELGFSHVRSPVEIGSLVFSAACTASKEFRIDAKPKGGVARMFHPCSASLLVPADWRWLALSDFISRRQSDMSATCTLHVHDLSVMSVRHHMPDPCHTCRTNVHVNVP